MDHLRLNGGTAYFIFSLTHTHSHLGCTQRLRLPSAGSYELRLQDVNMQPRMTRFQSMRHRRARSYQILARSTRYQVQMLASHDQVVDRPLGHRWYSSHRRKSYPTRSWYWLQHDLVADYSHQLGEHSKFLCGCGNVWKQGCYKENASKISVLYWISCPNTNEPYLW